MHELGREADGIGRHMRKAALEHLLGAAMRDANRKAKRLEQRRPKRHRVPKLKHAGNTDSDTASLANRKAWIFLEQKLFAVAKQIRNEASGDIGTLGSWHIRGMFRSSTRRLGNLAHQLIPGYLRTARTAVARGVERPVCKGDDGTLAMIVATTARYARKLMVRKAFHSVEANER